MLRMMDTPMKTKPWPHQEEDFMASRDLPGAFISWEPRLGKSKLIIDTAAYLYRKGEIDAAVVVAPNGVHLNWTREELPIHWPLDECYTLEWEARRAKTKRFQRKAQAALEHDGFVWLAVNVEAIASVGLVNMTKRGTRGFLQEFVRRRRVLFVVDESHTIMNPKADRTKAVFKLIWPGLAKSRRVALADYETAKAIAPYRRLLTGTPMPNGPFGLWSQYFVLDPQILGPIYQTFRARHGEFQKNREIRCSKCNTLDDYRETWVGRQRFVVCSACGNKDPVHGPLFDELISYRDLDKLNASIAPVTFPRKKSEIFEIPRLIVPRYFVMPDEHRKAYESMRNDFLIELEQDVRISAKNALTKLLKLQQVSRGYVKDAEGTMHELPGPRPAVDATLEMVQDHDGKTIVWCRHVPDVEMLVRTFREAGVGHIRCDGTVPQSERLELRRQFRDDPDATVWVGTLGAGGVGVDLPAADLMIFYSHGFDLVQRLQGLERNYTPNQKAERLDVVDLVAADTPDRKALDALARKEDLASQITGEHLRELLTETT